MWPKIFILAGLVASAFASTSCKTDFPTTPVVNVKNGSYAGIHSPQYEQDWFLGIRYAQASRFTRPTPLNETWVGTRNTTIYPPHCIGYGNSVPYSMVEDCLFLNVVRPAGINPNAKLPVAVWIHGGALLNGGSAEPKYNLTFIVHNGVQQDTPFIGVSINYRLSAFGFLTGQQAIDEGVANLGFRDQRQALHWVQENIGAFGGDPSKVTIWGESAGAESVSAHVLAFNGRDDGLFYAAVGESGFGQRLPRQPDFPGNYNNTARNQEIFDHLVQNTSCAATVGTSDAIPCLRKLPFEELNESLNVTNLQYWPPTLDGDFIADWPTNQLNNGKFVKVPILIGTNTDESTIFWGPKGLNSTGINTDTEFVADVQQPFGADVDVTAGKTKEQLAAEIALLWPDIQSIGLPNFDTWGEILTDNSTYSQQLGLQWRRGSAFWSDYVMHYARRRSNLAWSKFNVPSYSYRFNVPPQGGNPYLGVYHGTEIAFVFSNLDGDDYAVNPIGPLRSHQNVALDISRSWARFFATRDPNGHHTPSVHWPVYHSTESSGVGKNIVFSADEGNHVEYDDFRAEGIKWLIDNALTVFGQ